MYITLSSKNEASNTRFINKFLDTATIPPDSSVALASFTLNQRLDDDTITIPAGEYIYLRVDGQNIIRLQPNPTQTVTYTKQLFVQTMNALIPARKPYGVNIVFELDADDAILIKFYTEDAYDYPIDFLNYVYGENDRSLFYYGVRNTTTGVNLPDVLPINTNIGVNTRARPIQFNTNESFAMPAYFSTSAASGGLFFPTTAGVSWAFNRAKVFDFHDDLSNTIYDSFGVVTGPQGSAAGQPREQLTRSWNITWGVSQFDRASVRYSGIPAAIGAPIQKDFKEVLTLHGDYSITLNIWNNDNNDFDASTGNYLPGDVFQHFLQLPNYPAGTVPNDARLYVPFYRQLGYDGLQYYLPCNLNHVPDAGNRVYNTLRLKHEQADHFLQVQADQPETGQDYFDRMGFNLATTETACNKAIGVQSGYGQYLTPSMNIDNITPLFKSGKNHTVILDTSQVAEYFNNLPRLTRRDPTDPAGNVQNTLDRVSLSRNRIVTGASSAIQIFFSPHDDSANNTGVGLDNQLLIAGRHDNDAESFVIQIFLNNSAPQDITIGSRDNTQLPLSTTLVDGGGNRVNIQNGGRYGLIVCFTEGDTTVQVNLWEISADYTGATVYSATLTQPVNTFAGLNNPQCLGAKENADTTGSLPIEGFSGTIGHFRLYNFPAATTQLTLPNDFYVKLGRQWILSFDDNITCCVPSITNLFNSTDLKYSVTGNRFANTANEEENNNYCPCFYNTMPQTNLNRLANPNYPDIVDNFCIPAAVLPMAVSYVGTNNLDASSYLGNGGGIILTDNYTNFLDVENPVNQKVIAPYTWYEPGAANPWNTVKAEGQSLEQETQAIRIHIENLPHRTLNGTTGNLSKAIYEVQSDADRKNIDDEKKVMTITVPEKIRIPLNNAGNVVLNQFDVLITDQEDKELTNVLDHTSLTLEIV